MLMVPPCTLELNIVESEIETNCLEASICSRWIPGFMFSRTWSFQWGEYQYQLSLSLLQSIHLKTWSPFYFKITFPEGTANPARPLAQTVFWCSNDLANSPAPGEEERKFVLKCTFHELSDLCYISSFPTSFAILGESTLLLYVLDPWSKHHSWHWSLFWSCLGVCLCLVLVKPHDNDVLTNPRYCRGPWVCKSWERSIGSAGKAEVRNSRSWQGLEILSRVEPWRITDGRIWRS